MGQLKEDSAGQMLGEQDRAFSTTVRTQAEPLTGKRPEIVVNAFGGCAADSGHALKVLAKSPSTWITSVVLPMPGSSVKR